MDTSKDHENNDWFPLWLPVYRNPWRLQDRNTGAWLRERGRKPGSNPAYLFSSAEAAIDFLNSPKGRKAIILHNKADVD